MASLGVRRRRGRRGAAARSCGDCAGDAWRRLFAVREPRAGPAFACAAGAEEFERTNWCGRARASSTTSNTCIFTNFGAGASAGGGAAAFAPATAQPTTPFAAHNQLQTNTATATSHSQHNTADAAEAALIASSPPAAALTTA